MQKRDQGEALVPSQPCLVSCASPPDTTQTCDECPYRPVTKSETRFREKKSRKTKRDQRGSFSTQKIHKLSSGLGGSQSRKENSDNPPGDPEDKY